MGLVIWWCVLICCVVVCRGFYCLWVVCYLGVPWMVSRTVLFDGDIWVSGVCCFL